MTGSRVVFIESREQAAAVDLGSLDPNTTLVALTGEAVRELEELQLEHEPVSAFAHPWSLARSEGQFTVDYVRLLAEVEEYIAEREPSAPRGFLTGQAYHSYISIIAVAMRSFLMREVIRALRSETVSVFATTDDPWFVGDGYRNAPWVTVLESLAGQEAFRLEHLPSPPSVETLTALARPRRRAARAPKALLKRVAAPLARVRRLWPAEDGDALRLLFLNHPGYDWNPVVVRLQRSRATTCFRLDGAPIDPNRDWTFVLGNVVRRLWSSQRHVLTEPFASDPLEGTRLVELFDEWAAQRASPARLDVEGMNLFPALVANLRAMVALSPAIARHADLVADRALDIARPHAVCTYSLSWLASQRLAARARARGIPVVCYQHGGSYGTQDWIPHELSEWSHADYFLTYGAGVVPPAQPSFPLRAGFIPVGSARIAALPTRRRKRGKPHASRVLWIAAYATRNTMGIELNEDTERYLVERRCLEILGAADHLRVTYRPFPGQAGSNDVVSWLEDAKLARIDVDAVSPLADLIEAADVVISDTWSSTTWNEVIGAGKPFVLYCNETAVRLDATFADDLARACFWCKDSDALVAAVGQLSRQPGAFRDEGDAAGRDRYLRRYVLHDGRPVERVVSFLEEVCRDEHTVAEWSA